jgi:hypothetical protein
LIFTIKVSKTKVNSTKVGTKVVVMKNTVMFLMLFVVVACNQGKSENQDVGVVVDNPAPNPNPDDPVNIPLCETICDKNSSILKGNDNDLNYMSFQNFGYRGVGRCRGMAIVGQKMAELAQFDNSGESCDTKDMSKSCKENLTMAVEEVMDFKVTTIKGFASLYHFSNHPQVQLMLKSYVRGISHRYRAVRAHIEDPIYENEKINIFYEIQRRVKLNQQPYIGVKGVKALGHHALLAYENDIRDSRDIICVRDSNIIPDPNEGERCQNYIFHQNGNVYYHRLERDDEFLTIFSLTNDEDKRVANYIQARYDYCIDSNYQAGNCRMF